MSLICIKPCFPRWESLSMPEIQPWGTARGILLIKIGDWDAAVWCCHKVPVNPGEVFSLLMVHSDIFGDALEVHQAEGGCALWGRAESQQWGQEEIMEHSFLGCWSMCRKLDRWKIKIREKVKLSAHLCDESQVFAHQYIIQTPACASCCTQIPNSQIAWFHIALFSFSVCTEYVWQLPAKWHIQ